MGHVAIPATEKVHSILLGATKLDGLVCPSTTAQSLDWSLLADWDGLRYW